MSDVNQMVNNIRFVQKETEMILLNSRPGEGGESHIIAGAGLERDTAESLFNVIPKSNHKL